MKKFGRNLLLIGLLSTCIGAGAQSTSTPPATPSTTTGTDPTPPFPPTTSSVIIAVILGALL